MKWLAKGMIEPRQAILYNISSLDLTMYSLSVHKTPRSAPKSGNDLSQYLFYLNATYPDAHMSCRALRNRSLLNLLDPFLFYSIYTGSTYQSFGMPTARAPMIDLGFAKYLPALRFALTPFGGQYYLENFFLKNSIPTYLYLKWGQHGANTYYGFGIENRNIINWENASLGVKIDLWHQPNVLFKQGALSVDEIGELPKDALIPMIYPESVLTEKKFGAAVAVTGTYGIANSPAFLNLELGYKTKGYLPGEALRESLILRGGFSFRF